MPSPCISYKAFWNFILFRSRFVGIFRTRFRLSIIFSIHFTSSFLCWGNMVLLRLSIRRPLMGLSVRTSLWFWSSFFSMVMIVRIFSITIPYRVSCNSTYLYVWDHMNINISYSYSIALNLSTYILVIGSYSVGL